jgi:hypothetical protein
MCPPAKPPRYRFDDPGSKYPVTYVNLEEIGAFLFLDRCAGDLAVVASERLREIDQRLLGLVAPYRIVIDW